MDANPDSRPASGWRAGAVLNLQVPAACPVQVCRSVECVPACCFSRSQGDGEVPKQGSLTPSIRAAVPPAVLPVPAHTGVTAAATVTPCQDERCVHCDTTAH